MSYKPLLNLIEGQQKRAEECHRRLRSLSQLSTRLLSDLPRKEEVQLLYTMLLIEIQGYHFLLRGAPYYSNQTIAIEAVFWLTKH